MEKTMCDLTPTTLSFPTLTLKIYRKIKPPTPNSQSPTHVRGDHHRLHRQCCRLFPLLCRPTVLSLNKAINLVGEVGDGWVAARMLTVQGLLYLAT